MPKENPIELLVLVNAAARLLTGLVAEAFGGDPSRGNPPTSAGVLT
jgi:hypothetical protein